MIKTFKNISIICGLMLSIFSGLVPEAFASEIDKALAEAGQIEQSFDSGKSASDLSTLADYLAFADANSPAIRAAFYKWKGNIEQIAQISLPDPMLMHSFNPKNFNSDGRMPEYMIGVSQGFPWPGTIGSGKDAAFERARAEFQKFQSERYALHYMVKKGFYEYYLLNREISIVRDNIYLIESWEAVARAGYTSADKPQSDLLMAQVELGKMKTRLSSLEDKINPYKEYLRSLVYLPDSINIAAPDTISDEILDIDEGRVKTVILQVNPDLQSMSYMTAMERNMVRQAAKMNLPMFNVGLDYKSAGASMNQDMTQEPQHSWMVNIGISIPIWLGRNKARNNEAKARLMEAEYGQLDFKSKLGATIDQKLFDLRDARRQIELYQSGLIALAEQSLNTAYKSYQAGSLEFISVIDAQRQLLDFILDLEQARVDYSTTRAELEMLMGQDIDNFRL
ncbi:MAG: hypothetical protein CVT49_06450 [candidate division Zixibacteria bacterium HGW-Zixibacteria-1]|nr:MAG: hypothetical protein CVT49_06450 [candidate division Zixibacteria bacterium HGW-Zixibacteria-1]